MRSHCCSILCLLWLAVAPGCTDRSGRTAGPPASNSGTAVGWQAGQGEPLRSGQMLTEPPGREESLIPAIPTATRAWTSACAGESAVSPGPIDLRLVLGPDGQVRSAEAIDPGPWARCLCAKARGQTIDQVHLPGDTRVRLHLVFGH